MIRTVLLSAVILAAAPVAAASTRDRDPAAVVDAFAAAQRSFDQITLTALTAPDFVEISPLGEVDPREKMLGFYAPDKKVQAPAVTIDERSMRSTGDLAVVTQRQTFGERAMRALYVLRRDAGRWRLVSAQYTPIHVVKPA